MISLLIALLARPQAATVSLHVEVGRAEKAVAELAKASGIPMSVTEPVASEVVFLSVDNLPASTVMNSIARVTAAEWIKKGDGPYVLARSSAIVAKEERKEQDRKLSALSAWRDNLVKCLDIPYDEDSLKQLVLEESQGTYRLQHEKLPRQADEDLQKHLRDLQLADPMFRAMARCVQGLDLNSVASLAPGQTIVFAGKPNPVQFALPEGAIAACRSLAPEQLVWGRALRTQPLAEGQELESRFSTDQSLKDSDTVFPTLPWQRTVPFSQSPSNVLLTIACEGGDYFTFYFKMLSDQGKEILEFEPDGLWTRAQPDLADAEHPNLAAPSEETKALWKRWNTYGEGAKASIGKLKRFFDDPVHNDPLWMGNQEILSKIANLRQKSIIVCLPDEAEFLTDQNLEVDHYVQRFHLQSTELADRIEIAPSDFVRDWQTHADRRLMARCMNGGQNLGKIDLFDFVRLIASAGSEGDRNFATLFIQLPDPGFRTERATFEVPQPSAFTRLLASLSPDQLARIGRGETLFYSALSSQQRDFAEQIVYGIRVNITEEGEVMDPSYFISPTLELPDGLPANEGLSGSIGADKFAVLHNPTLGMSAPWFKVNLDYDGSREPFEYALHGQPHLETDQIAGTTVSFDSQRFITLKCELSPKHFIVGRFAAPLDRTAQKPTPLKEVSGKTREKLDKFFAPTGFDGTFQNSGQQAPPP